VTGPHSAALAAQLSDIAAGITTALLELERDPEPSRAEAAAIRLDGARQYVQLLGEAVRRERADAAALA
jgi:hypothetical protein